MTKIIKINSTNLSIAAQSHHILIK